MTSQEQKLLGLEYLKRFVYLNLYQHINEKISELIDSDKWPKQLDKLEQLRRIDMEMDGNTKFDNEAIEWLKTLKPGDITVTLNHDPDPFVATETSSS